MNLKTNNWIPNFSGIMLGLWVAYMVPIHIDAFASGAINPTILGHLIAALLGAIGAVMIIMHKFHGAIINCLAHSIGAIMGFIDIQFYSLEFPPLPFFVPIALIVMLVAMLPLLLSREILD